MFEVRRAVLTDVEAFVAQRLALCREMHDLAAGPDEDWLAASTRAAFVDLLAQGETNVWLATGGGDVVGSVALHLLARFPSLQNRCAREAYVSHVFVAPGWRRRGVGSALMGALVQHARDLGLARVRLHATEPGRALYETLGFRLRTNDMELRLASDASG